MSVSEFAEKVARIGLACGFSVTSWGRSATHNAKVGGLDGSYHRLWMAVDGILDQPSDKAEFVHWCRREGISVLDEGDHLHVQPATGSTPV
jgi:hypothetical protein